MAATSIEHVAHIDCPDEIRDLPAWLIWRYEPGDKPGDKPKKVPYYAAGSRRKDKQGSPDDRAQLVTFDAARAAAARRKFTGVGIAVLADWGIVALDFDHCIKGGHLHPEVEAIALGSYSERSPSGEGVRVLLRGRMFNRKSHGEPFGFEVFSDKGFVTFTGDKLFPDFGVDGLSNIGNEVMALARKRFALDTSGKPASHGGEVLGLSQAEIENALAKVDPDCGHDDWLHVGMALHHETRGEGFEYWDEWSSAGGKYPGRDALWKRWDSFGRNNDTTITAKTLLKAAGISLTTPAAADEFEAVLAEAEAEAITAKKPPRFNFEPVHLFSSTQALPWIIKGVLPQAGLAVMYGASGSGKSFAALDMGMAIAQGIEWRGRRVKQGAVAYIAAEGADGFRKRVAAYALKNGTDLASVPMTVLSASPNLMEKDDARDIVLGIRASGGADVVIVDTFAQTTPGANENAGEDVGKALGHCKRIHEQTGALVVLIHHSGKDATKGARGWSGLRAAADAEIEVIREGDQRALQLTKNKDGEDGLQWGFALEVVELGVDDDLDPITSCVVVEAAIPVGREAGFKPAGKNQATLYEVLREFGQAQSVGIEVSAVLDAAVKKRLADRGDDKGDPKGNVRGNLRKALGDMLRDENCPFEVEDEDGKTLRVC